MRGSIRGRAAAALCLTLTILTSQVVATPVPRAGERSPLLGEVTAFGQVQVNGAEAASGATVFSGSTFTTAKKSRAIVNLGAAGRVQLASETASTIDFGEQSLDGAVDAGVIMVSKPEAVTSRFVTKDAEVVALKDSAAVFTVNVTGGNTVVKAVAGSVELRTGKTKKLLAAGESATVGVQTTPQDDDDDDDQGGWFWFGVVGFVAEVGGAIIWALSQDDDGTGSPNLDPILTSPVR